MKGVEKRMAHVLNPRRRGFMKTTLRVVASVTGAALLAGCVTVSEYRFALDTTTGAVLREYIDLASRQGPNENDYSVTNDWATLKQLAAEKKPEYDPDVVEDVAKELFATNNVLCGRKLQKVKGPKCFPSKAALLAYLHEKDWRFEMLNDEVFLILPTGKRLVSTNGQKLTTAKNTLIVWPGDATRFEYAVSEQWSGGTSLLPHFLKEQAKQK
jgi:hypothetical protein